MSRIFTLFEIEASATEIATMNNSRLVSTILLANC
jgi:hypothetical protein